VDVGREESYYKKLAAIPDDEGGYVIKMNASLPNRMNDLVSFFFISKSPCMMKFV